MKKLIKPVSFILILGFLFAACKKEPVQQLQSIVQQPPPPVKPDTIPLPFNYFDTICVYTDDYQGTETFAVWYSHKTLHLPVLDDIDIRNLKVSYRINNGTYTELHENNEFFNYKRTGGDLLISLFIIEQRHITVFVRVTA